MAFTPPFPHPQAKFRSVRVISTVGLGVLGSSVLVLEEGAHRREVGAPP